MPLKAAIARVINFHDLSFDEAAAAMDVIMGGEATAAQVGSYLTALRMKGETVDEIAGSADSMIRHVVPVKMASQNNNQLVDIVGTGGDGIGTFNISTTAAFVVAAAGPKVAKHGNRAASSKSGAADVLLAMGSNLDLTPEQVAECIEEVGIGFLYAVHHHPAMRYAIGPRRELGQRTIFNVLGPLTNPAGARRQLIGVYDRDLTEPMANVLKALGSKAAYVVHGDGGLDELSTTGVNQVSYLHDDVVTTFALDPQSLGLPRASMNDLLGGPPEENAQITRAILAGLDTGPRRDIVVLNAAGVLCLDSNNWEDGLEQARKAIDSGAALRTLEAWIDKTNSFSSS